MLPSLITAPLWVLGAFALLCAQLGVVGVNAAIIVAELVAMRALAATRAALRWASLPLTPRWREHRRLLAALSRQRAASTFDAWLAAATELDALDGAAAWRASPDSDDFDAPLVRATMERLRRARHARDVPALTFALASVMDHRFGGIDNPALYARSRVGTKHAVEAFIAEVQRALGVVADSDLSPPAKLRFFEGCRVALGRTALALSGGGALALAHAGVVRALITRGLLPRVVSGTSGGSIVVALMALLTDEELLATGLTPSIVSRGVAPQGGDGGGGGGGGGGPVRFFEPLGTQLWHFVSSGLASGEPRLVDSGRFGDALRAYFGDSTFGDAYARTGRIAAISVTVRYGGGGGGQYNRPLVLNYLSTPQVLLWSAVAASCAAPGLMRPVTLMARDHRGRTVPFHPVPGVSSLDGSMASDLPLEALGLLFRATRSIVSQTNPHVVPFLAEDATAPGVALAGGRSGGAGGVLSSVLWAVEVWLNLDVRQRTSFLAKMRLLPRFFGADVASVFLQKYSGDVTIVPAQGTGGGQWRALSQPSEDDMARFIAEGERATWPHLSHIRTLVGVEKTLSECARRFAGSGGGGAGGAGVAVERPLTEGGGAPRAASPRQPHHWDAAPAAWADGDGAARRRRGASFGGAAAAVTAEGRAADAARTHGGTHGGSHGGGGAPDRRVSVADRRGSSRDHGGRGGGGGGAGSSCESRRSSVDSPERRVDAAPTLPTSLALASAHLGGSGAGGGGGGFGGSREWWGGPVAAGAGVDGGVVLRASTSKPPKRVVSYAVPHGVTGSASSSGLATLLQRRADGGSGGGSGASGDGVWAVDGAEAPGSGRRGDANPSGGGSGSDVGDDTRSRDGGGDDSPHVGYGLFDAPPAEHRWSSSGGGGGGVDGVGLAGALHRAPTVANAVAAALNPFLSPAHAWVTPHNAEADDVAPSASPRRHRSGAVAAASLRPLDAAPVRRRAASPGSVPPQTSPRHFASARTDAGDHGGRDAAWLSGLAAGGGSGGGGGWSPPRPRGGSDAWAPIVATAMAEQAAALRSSAAAWGGEASAGGGPGGAVHAPLPGVAALGRHTTPADVAAAALIATAAPVAAPPRRTAVGPPPAAAAAGASFPPRSVTGGVATEAYHAPAPPIHGPGHHRLAGARAGPHQLSAMHNGHRHEGSGGGGDGDGGGGGAHHPVEHDRRGGQRSVSFSDGGGGGADYGDDEAAAAHAAGLLPRQSLVADESRRRRAVSSEFLGTGDDDVDVGSRLDGLRESLRSRLTPTPPPSDDDDDGGGGGGGGRVEHDDPQANVDVAPPPSHAHAARHGPAAAARSRALSRTAAPLPTLRSLPGDASDSDSPATSVDNGGARARHGTGALGTGRHEHMRRDAEADAAAAAAVAADAAVTPPSARLRQSYLSLALPAPVALPGDDAASIRAASDDAELRLSASASLRAPGSGSRPVADVGGASNGGGAAVQREPSPLSPSSETNGAVPAGRGGQPGAARGLWEAIATAADSAVTGAVGRGIHGGGVDRDVPRGASDSTATDAPQPLPGSPPAATSSHGDGGAAAATAAADASDASPPLPAPYPPPTVLPLMHKSRPVSPYRSQDAAAVDNTRSGGGAPLFSIGSPTTPARGISAGAGASMWPLRR